ncbi:hypothetical protein L1987_66618 [Smallanthus sonchifolius]|uniref:Uncharacterized protein n=1 Tax=Smallanthus sonchifolius TaxID=185202 RepID=A0ACB9BXM0_9ASTR|nr:hypothetical protein L1987_66618 [Smallanthus sonchifolius]
MVARVSRSPATLISLISLSLSLLLLWCTITTTTTIILRHPPPIATAIRIIKQDQEDQHYISLSTRRALRDKNAASQSTEFDFTPFVHGQQHQHQHHQHPARGSEIDPRYGVEMRLVPSGPNPLHH